MVSGAHDFQNDVQTTSQGQNGIELSIADFKVGGSYVPGVIFSPKILLGSGRLHFGLRLIWDDFSITYREIGVDGQDFPISN